MPRTIKVGLAGLGRAGRFMHIPELLQLRDKFVIAAVCDCLPERVEELPEGVGDVRRYTDFASLCADPEVELVSIATWSEFHVEQAILALEKGKYVVLDKPFALSHGDALKLQAVAEKHQGKLFLRFNRRFEPAFNAVREILDSGILGRVGMVKLYRHTGYVRRFDWQTLAKHGGGMLNNWGPHLVDQALQLLGAPVKDLWCDLQHRVSAGDAEDQVKLLLRGENGRVADIEISNVVTLAANWYELWGDRGSLTVPAGGKVLKLKYLAPDLALPPLQAVDGPFPITAYKNQRDKLEFIEEERPISTGGRTYQNGKLVDPATVDHSAGYTYHDTMWDHVYAAVSQGVPYPIDVADGVEVVRVTEEAKRASGYNPALNPLCE